MLFIFLPTKLSKLIAGTTISINRIFNPGESDDAQTKFDVHMDHISSLHNYFLKTSLYSKTELDALFIGYYNKSSMDTLLLNYFPKREITTLLSTKQHTITGAASSDYSTNLYGSKVVISDASGKQLNNSTSSLNSGILTCLTPVGRNVQTQSDGTQASITGGASSITVTNLTCNKALISDLNGKLAVSSVTDTELGYVSSVNIYIQTQLKNLVKYVNNCST